MRDGEPERPAVFLLLLPVLLTGGLVAAELIDPAPGAAIIAAIVIAGLWLWRRRRIPVQPSPAVVDGSQPKPADLLECLPDPVILLNAKRELVASNAAARDTLGIGPLGRDLALSLRHPIVLAAAESVAQGAPSFAEEVTLPSPIPRTFALYAAGLPVTGPDQPARIILVFRDETQVKRAEQSRADFVANASHELRSPLSAIIGFIETLLGPASDDEEARTRFLTLMHAEAQRMARLVDDLMSLSRVEINEHIPPRVAVDAAALLRGVATTLAVRAEKKQMTVEVDCPTPLPEVVGDADQLTQVFHNLVDNAVKYGRSGTCIRVLVRPVDRLPGTSIPGMSIAVADEGEGIPAIHLPRLTERFYRADEGRSRRLGGTGLGLAIVKHIVKRHRGRLTMESELGRGSTFTVFLPLAMQHPREIRVESTDGSDDVTKL
jgi:Signal transduction histidine kinase